VYASASRAGPEISVIVPCHNVAAYVRETLEAIRSQTFADWEAILVDDGSTDGTGAILDAVAAREPRMRIVRQTNQRLAAARNNGVAASRGRKVLFLDAGDRVEAHTLERLDGLLSADPAAGAAFGGWRFIAPDGRDGQWFGEAGKCVLSFPDFAATNPVNTDALLIRREWLESAGPFDGSLPACEDWDLWARIARAGCRFVGTDEPLAVYRMEPSSHSRRVMPMLEAGFAVIRRTHGRDDRCRRPAPGFAEGAPAGRCLSALSDWCAYCLAVAYGQGGPEQADLVWYEASRIIRRLDPIALARHLYVAVPYAKCTFPSEWPELLRRGERELLNWLLGWETRLGAPGFAVRCETHLRQLVFAEEILEEVLDRIDARPGLRRVIVYGCGRNGRRLLQRLSRRPGLEVVGVDDASDGKGTIQEHLPGRPDQLIVVSPWSNHAMCRRLIGAGARPGRDFITLTDTAGAALG